MGNLFLSFTIAIGGAIGVVTLGRLLAFDTYISGILPIIPILYAIVYEVLDRKKTGRSAKSTPTAVERTKIRSADVEAGITADKIAADVAVSFAIKFSLEIFLVALFLRYSGQSFSDVYGVFSFETVGAFFRGEHPWLTGKESLYLLALVAVAASFATGSWIGHTSRGNAILEGVIAGALVTLINSMTNMVVLYRTLEDMTVRLAGSMGYVMRASFLIVMGLQVLLYGLWSGVVQTRKREAEEQKKTKRAKK